MLNAVFGTTKNPFTKELSPAELFLSSSWQVALKQLQMLLQYRGTAIITGDPGSGKSTLARLVTSQLNPKACRILYLCDVLLSDIDFLRLLASHLGLEPPYQKAKLIRSIRHTLAELNDSQRIQPILILDEVHLVKNTLLEQLRILTNFAMDSRELLTTILIGQPHFLGKLSLNINLPLKQRISYLVKLPALSATETASYITHRLKIAGIKHPVFSPEALNALYQASTGLPRQINRIAFTALSLASQAGENTVSDDLLTQAIEEMELRP